MKPTRTINKIHFSDLSPDRFEDLCLSLIYALERWEEINHFGRLGTDDGIDIQTIQKSENDTKREWIIQCKRWQSLNIAEMKKTIDAVLNKRKKIPDTFLLIAACDVSKRTIDLFKDYANKIGIKNPLFWGSSLLEAKLFNDRQDLLFAYFGISLVQEKRTKIASIRRNIQLKKQMRNEFVRKNINNWNEVRECPSKKFISSEFLIRSIMDKTYPDQNYLNDGILGWFKVESHNFYHNGIEVILSIREAIINSDKKWDIVYHDDPRKKEEYKSFNVVEIGRIPYENIVAYDIDGDEYYNFPHIFCEFANNGEPYEEIQYSPSKQIDGKLDRTFYGRLDNSDRLK